MVIFSVYSMTLSKKLLPADGLHGIQCLVAAIIVQWRFLLHAAQENWSCSFFWHRRKGLVFLGPPGGVRHVFLCNEGTEAEIMLWTASLQC